MSKRKFKKSPFDAPSQTCEKYAANLEKSKSGETSKASVDEESSSALSGTDASMADNAIPNYGPTAWEPPLWLKNIAPYIAIGLFILGIIGFFWNMNASVNETKHDVSKVTDRIQVVETDIGSLAKEDAERHSDVKRYFVELLSKLDRVLDRLPNQNQDVSKAATQKGSKGN
jgi:hypothetical protein